MGAWGPEEIEKSENVSIDWPNTSIDLGIFFGKALGPTKKPNVHKATAHLCVCGIAETTGACARFREKNLERDRYPAAVASSWRSTRVDLEIRRRRRRRLTTRRAGAGTRACSQSPRPLLLWIRSKTFSLYVDRIPSISSNRRRHTTDDRLLFNLSLLSHVVSSFCCCRCLASPKIWWPFFVVPSWPERPTAWRPWAEGSTARFLSSMPAAVPSKRLRIVTMGTAWEAGRCPVAVC